MEKTINQIEEQFHFFEEIEIKSWGTYFREAVPETVEQLGISVMDAGTALAVATATVDTLAMNRVMGAGLLSPVSAAEIDEFIEFYRQNNVPRFFIQLCPVADDLHIRELLAEKGFVKFNHWVKLFRRIEPFPIANTALAIEQIGISQANDFAELIVSGFGWDSSLKPMISAVVGLTGWHHYIAFDGRKPVACAALFIDGEYAELAFAATLPEYRGHGAQSALIARRFRDAAAAGAKWMISETAEELPDRPVPSFRNMIRAGFRVAYLRPNYLFTF